MVSDLVLGVHRANQEVDSLSFEERDNKPKTYIFSVARYAGQRLSVKKGEELESMSWVPQGIVRDTIMAVRDPKAEMSVAAFYAALRNIPGR